MSAANARAQCASALRSCHDAGPCPLGSAQCDLAEAAFWAGVDGEWQCLFGSHCRLGLSVEWHDFSCDAPVPWSGSFHPGGLEICLNLSGRAQLSTATQTVNMSGQSVIVYATHPVELRASRFPGERHQFLTLELSGEFLDRHFKGRKAGLHPAVRKAVSPSCRASRIGQAVEMEHGFRRSIDELRNPALRGPALDMWYEAQALSLAAHLFFVKPVEATFAQSRQEQVARARVERAIAVLKKDLANPPTLSQLGKAIGCSPFHLSRTFSSQMKMTIPQFIRKIRMERAAELLKSGSCNVTEAAMQVGYSSLSHFSQAFCDVMGCCPGLFPLGLSRSRLLPGVAAAGAKSESSRQAAA